MVGSTISHYEVLQKLGEGGMGVVYKARDSRLERFIALKILPSEKITDSERERRFVREAKAASALNHPNIVTIYDTDAASGCYFIAMEYIEGQSLDRLIPRKGMRLADVLRYGVQVADALACAHRAGIVHRDLKPANVMVTDRGLVKVVDFGLAKLTERNLDSTGASGETITAKSDSVTEEGYIVGTLAYMSPEQAEDKPLDGRSDVFSMGCVLYEMVTGKRAFQGETKLRTLSAILTHEPPRISDLAENVPPELERVVSRCLRKDPERRFQGMADLKIALEELKEESESGRLVSVRQPKRRERSRAVVFTATAAVVLILGIASARWFLFRQPKAASSPELSHPTPVTSYRGTEESATLSPDGRQVAFSGNVESPDNYDIYVKFIGSDPPLRLTHDPNPDQRPVWSPDGRWIAFVRFGKSSQLILISPLGGGERLIAEAERLTCVSWTSDSKNVLATVGDVSEGKADLVAISIDNGERKRMLQQVASA
jgi:eukaryotic-like serine/threonine-protein kinase